MGRVRGRDRLLLGVLLATTGCVRDYRGPRPGEPAAEVMVQLASSVEDLLRPLPADVTRWELRLEVRAQEDGGPQLVAWRRWTEASELVPRTPLEPLMARVRAEQSLSLEVRLALVWQTRRTELLFRDQQGTGPIYVPQGSRSFNAGQFQSEVVRADDLRCASVVQLAPLGGAAYLVEVRSLAGGQHCPVEVRPAPATLPDPAARPY